MKDSALTLFKFVGLYNIFLSISEKRKATRALRKHGVLVLDYIENIAKISKPDFEFLGMSLEKTQDNTYFFTISYTVSSIPVVLAHTRLFAVYMPKLIGKDAVYFCILPHIQEDFE